MKKILCLILCVCICFGLCGCTAVEEALSEFYSAATVEERPHIGFSGGILFEDSKEVIFEATEVDGFDNISKNYRADLFYNTLDNNQKTIYIALEYAMENGYTNILVDDLLAADSASLETILQYMALDSPLLEQNLRYETGDFNTYYENGIFGNALFDGFYITVKNFTKEFWDKKKEAIKKAEEIVAALPEGLDQAQKADSLYRTVAKAEYYDYDNQDTDSVFPYLYDALIIGRTHCDGYTNAISLLYNMVGIKCVEKNYTPVDGEIGHTWNLFEIDGKWYNCDATGGDMIPKKDCGMGAGYLFGFSNILQKYAVDYSEVYPVSEEGLYIQIDAHIASADNNALYTTASQGYRNNNNNWVLVILDSCDETLVDNQMQKMADRFNTSIQYYLYPIAEGRTAVFVCKADICE